MTIASAVPCSWPVAPTASTVAPARWVYCPDRQAYRQLTADAVDKLRSDREHATRTFNHTR